MLMPLSDGGFGTCQVTAVDSGVIAAYALRWHSVDPPALADLDGVEPLTLDHHAHAGRLAHLCITRSWPIPPGFIRLGNLPVPAGVPALSNSFSGWQSLAGDVIWQRRWDHELPAAAKQAYRTAATRGQIEVDFGAGAVTTGAAATRLDLTGEGTMPVPAAGQVRWSALDQLPRCTTLVWSGPDRGLSAALAARPIISSLVWRDAPATVDLSGTALLSVKMTGENLRDLRLPPGVEDLKLTAPDRRLSVAASDGGRWLRLTMTAPDPQVVIPAGLEQVRDVVLDGGGTLSAATLDALEDLQTLRLHWGRPPGRLLDAANLAGLNALAVVEIDDGYGLEADTLPELPSLSYLGINGMRRSIVPALKARYRGTAVRLVILGAKPDSWLAANLNNPFRDWVDDDARGGAAACKAYANALRAVDKLPPAGAERIAEAEKTLRAMVETLNGIEQKYEIIDTIRREEAVHAFHDLAARAEVPPPLADQWIDEWRDF